MNSNLLWRPWQHITENQVPTDLWHWLTYRGSLTQQLQQLTQGAIEHHLHFAGWKQPLADEYQLLGLNNNEAAWVRTIEWRLAGSTLVWGHAVIPASSLHGPGHKLAELTSGSLGDILFQDQQLMRDPFEVALLPQQHALLPNHIEEPRWARRSILHFANKPLLITEIFFPPLPCYQASA